MDKTIEKINNDFRSLNITGYYFGPMVDINCDHQLSNKIIDKVNLANRLRAKIDESFIYFSDKNAESCFYFYKRYFAESDPAFTEMSKMKVKSKVFSYSDPLTKKQKRWFDTMARFGYRSRGASVFELKHFKPFLGLLVFFSDKEPHELEEVITESEKFTHTVDSLTHFLLSVSDANANPWVSLGAISQKSHEILNLLASGCETTEISEIMSLSERGVHYHVETLKELLQARNRTHLVVKALKKGIIK